MINTPLILSKPCTATETAKFLDAGGIKELTFVNKKYRSYLHKEQSSDSFIKDLCKEYPARCADIQKKIANIKSFDSQGDPTKFRSILNEISELKKWSSYFPENWHMSALFKSLVQSLDSSRIWTG